MKHIECLEKKEKPSGNYGFGKYFTDHMVMMDYEDGKWNEPVLMPYSDVLTNPASLVLHYALETFEGLKAYKRADGIYLFRPYMNAVRMNSSNERLCMPKIDENIFIECVKALVKADSDWIPTEANSSLYLRPFCYATEVGVGVHKANKYRFIVIASPVGTYYKTGLKPVNIYVEDIYSRAAKGGTGNIKCGGNYASSILGQEKAKMNNCEQVLWLDAESHTYISEVGTMNVMFVKDGKVITPFLDGTILPGITRNSILTLLDDLDIPHEERKITIDEIVKGILEGSVTEAFGTGTAAVVSPIGKLLYKDKEYLINNGIEGKISKLMFDKLDSIRTGKEKDIHGWMLEVK